MSDPLAHCRFWTLLAERRHRPKLKIAQHLGRITEEKLAVLFEVDAALLHLPFVNRMTSLEQVREINAALSAIGSLGQPERPSMGEGCGGGGKGGNLHRLIHGDEVLDLPVPLTMDGIAGRSAYVAYEPGGKPVGMAQLFNLTNGSWMVEGV